MFCMVNAGHDGSDMIPGSLCGWKCAGCYSSAVRPPSPHHHHHPHLSIHRGTQEGSKISNTRWESSAQQGSRGGEQEDPPHPRLYNLRCLLTRQPPPPLTLSLGKKDTVKPSSYHWSYKILTGFEMGLHHAHTVRRNFTDVPLSNLTFDIFENNGSSHTAGYFSDCCARGSGAPRHVTSPPHMMSWGSRCKQNGD